MSSLNLEAAMARLGGDTDLMSELAGMFVTQLPELLGEAEKGLQAPDTGAAVTPAHTLKGLLAQFGAEDAHLLAKDLELAAKQNRRDDSLALLERLKAACAEVLPALERLARGETGAG